MRLVVFSLAALCCAAPAASQTPSPVSLTEREAVARALSGNPRLLALTARVDEVRALQAERALWPNPSATYTRESAGNTHDTFVLATQELPISGRRGRLQAAGQVAVQIAQAEGRFESSRIQAELRDAYSQLVVAQARHQSIRQSIATLQQLIAMLRARENDGEGSAYDRMRGERALIDLDAELSAAGAARLEAAARLAAFFSPAVAPESIVATDELMVVPTPMPVAALVARALANRQDHHATALAVDRFAAERAAASLLKIPTPTLTGGVKRSDVSGFSSGGFQFSVDLSVPLFNRGAAAIALADAQRSRAAAEVEASRIRIAAEVESAYRSLTFQQERLARYRESAARVAEPLARIGRVAYEEGEVGILELLDAERQALDARLRILEFAAAVRRAAIELDRVTGEDLKP